MDMPSKQERSESADCDGSNKVIPGWLKEELDQSRLFTSALVSGITMLTYDLSYKSKYKGHLWWNIRQNSECSIANQPSSDTCDSILIDRKF